MGIFGDLFGKKPHDPAQALIDWLKDKPVACRRQVADSCGPLNFGGRVTHWIVTRPDCDRGTAARVFWETMIHVPAELAAARENAAVPTPYFDLVKMIGERWSSGCYAPPEQGLDTGDYWTAFTKKLRQHRFKASDFAIPADLHETIPGERFSYWTFWSPKNEREKLTMEDLIGDIWVCDRAVEVPKYGLPARKARLGY